MDITVTVKAVAHGTTPITMASTAPVQDLRAAAARTFGAPPSALRLVLSGRFISDNTTLAEAGVVDGSVIHALVKQDPEASSTPGASTRDATQAQPQGPQPDDEEEWRPRPQRLVDPPPPAASPSIDLSGLFGGQAGGFFGAIADSLAAASQGQPAAPAAPTTAPSGSGTAAGATDPLDELLSGFFAGPTAADPSSAPAQSGGAGSAPTQAPAGPGLEGFDFGAVAGSVSDFMQAAAPVIQGAFAEAAREMTEERTAEQNRVRVEEVESSSSSASGDVSYLSEVVSEDEAAQITAPIPPPNAHGTNTMGTAPAPARTPEAPTPQAAQAQPPAQTQAQPQAPPQAHVQAQAPPFFFAAPPPPPTFAVNVHVNPADLATLHTRVGSFYTRMGAAQFPANPQHDHAHDAAHHAAHQQQVAEAHQQLHQQMLQQVQQQQRQQQQAPPAAAVEAPNRGTAARLAHDVQHEVRLENAGQAHGYPRPSLAQVAVSSGIVPLQPPSTTTVGGSEGQVGEAASPTLLSRVSRVMLDGGDVPGLLRVVRGDWSAFDPLRPALAAALRASADRSPECETGGAAAAAAEDTLVTAPMRRVMAGDLTAGVLGLFEFPALGVALRQHAQPGVEVPAVVHVAARELAADVVDLVLDGAPQSERGLFSSHLRSRVVRRVGHLSSYLRRHGVRGDSEADRDSASASLMAALVEAVLDAATAPLPELRASLRPSVSVAATAIVAWRAEYEAALRLPADDDLFAVAAASGGLSDEALSRAVSSLEPEGLGAEGAGASPGADSGLEALLGAALMRAAGSADTDTMRAPSPNAAADLDAALGGLRGQLRQL